MDSIVKNSHRYTILNKTEGTSGQMDNLTNANINKEYNIKKVNTTDADMKNFLFTLGCYEGEKITVISMLADNYIITVKDARYSIDKELAEAILV